VDWTDLAQDRDEWRAPVNTVMYLRAPYHAGKFLGSYTTGGLRRRVQLHGVKLAFLLLGSKTGMDRRGHA
jgi:hypothetical protein